MKRFIIAAMIGAFCSLSCDSPDYGPPPVRRGPRSFCEQFTSCGACTPVLGCGWCQAGDKGLCAADPNACEGATSFSWTWDSSGCPGVSGAPDAGRDAAVDAGAKTDARHDAAEGG
jgi:hypothetical protein